MKQFLTTAIIISLSGGFFKVQAQQRPHYTQYILNNYILNPALTGIENYTDVKLSGRNQWVGLNGAPQTAYLTAHGPIGKKDVKTTATSFSLPGENPRGQSYWENYTASEPHHGVGVTIINDKTGLLNRFSGTVSYAYHLGLSPKTNLSAGFAAGFNKITYDRSKATPNDPLDPALGNGTTINKVRPDVSAGLWLYSDRSFVGLSAQQIIPQDLSFAESSSPSGKLIPHLFATAGYRFLVNDEVNLLPSILVKYVSTSEKKVQFDLNAKAQYRDLLWLGASYRLDDGYAAMLGLNLLNAVHVGYSYDFSATPLRTASRGTHELILGFLIGNKYGDTCPRNVW